MKRSDFLAWIRRVALILFLVVAAMVSRCVHPYHGRAREIGLVPISDRKDSESFLPGRRY
jgi:hypothetical protein